MVAELAITADDIRQNACYVAEQDGAVVGFYLIVDDSLERCFVSPDHMRQGIGRTLFEHAVAELGGRHYALCPIPMRRPSMNAWVLDLSGRKSRRLSPGRRLPVYEFNADSD